jgi:hypothetical protein
MISGNTTYVNVGIGFEDIHRRNMVIPIWSRDKSYQNMRRQDLAWQLDQIALYGERKPHPTKGYERIAGPILLTGIARAVHAHAMKTDPSGSRHLTVFNPQSRKPSRNLYRIGTITKGIDTEFFAKKNLIDVTLESADGDLKLNHDGLRLYGKLRDMLPEAARTAAIGKRLKDIIALDLFEDDDRTITSVRSDNRGFEACLHFGISEPKTAYVGKLDPDLT